VPARRLAIVVTSLNASIPSTGERGRCVDVWLEHRLGKPFPRQSKSRRVAPADTPDAPATGYPLATCVCRTPTPIVQEMTGDGWRSLVRDSLIGPSLISWSARSWRRYWVLGAARRPLRRRVVRVRCRLRHGAGWAQVMRAMRWQAPRSAAVVGQPWKMRTTRRRAWCTSPSTGLGQRRRRLTPRMRRP